MRKTQTIKEQPKTALSLFSDTKFVGVTFTMLLGSIVGSSFGSSLGVSSLDVSSLDVSSLRVSKFESLSEISETSNGGSGLAQDTKDVAHKTITKIIDKTFFIVKFFLAYIKL